MGETSVSRAGHRRFRCDVPAVRARFAAYQSSDSSPAERTFVATRFSARMRKNFLFSARRAEEVSSLGFTKT